MSVEISEAESAAILREWNEFAYGRWNAMTPDEQAKATRWSKEKWKKITAHCSGTGAHYTINPDDPTDVDVDLTEDD